VRNGQSDIIGIINSTGTQVVAYAYDAWGNPISTSGTLASTIGKANPLRYRGYYFDEETGFYYLNSRYYDHPAVGRFINADGFISTGQGVLGSNMFAYCGNNPVSNHDPDGRIFDKIADAIKNLFNAIVNNAVNDIAVQTGNYQLANQIGNQIKMGDGKTTPNTQTAVDLVADTTFVVDATVSVGVPVTKEI